MDTSFVDELKNLMEQEAAVHAMWIGGSVAEGYDDKLSDIDLYFDVSDGQENAVFSSIENFLKSKGELDINFSENDSPPFSHKVYHLAHMNPYHFIEVTLHSHSHTFGLFDKLRKINVLFDKDGVTAFQSFDKKGYDEMLSERRLFLIEKIGLGELSVKKEIQRGQFPDAVHNYQYWLVDPIIELARIKYAPLKLAYGLKHASRDLPSDTVNEIESLYLIDSLENLNDKILEVKAMLKKYSR